MLPSPPAVDVHGQQGEDPGERDNRGGPGQLFPGSSVPPDKAGPGFRQGGVRDRRGLGRSGERGQQPGHLPDLRSALHPHSHTKLADSQGGLARRQRKDVPQGPGVDPGLTAHCAPGQGHQDAAHSVQCFFLPQLAGLRYEGLRFRTGEQQRF